VEESIRIGQSWVLLLDPHSLDQALAYRPPWRGLALLEIIDQFSLPTKYLHGNNEIAGNQRYCGSLLRLLNGLA